jgi:hypothetical protein
LKTIVGFVFHHLVELWVTFGGVMEMVLVYGEVQARYFVHTCCLVFYLKIRKKQFETFNVPLTFQNK